MKRGRWALEVLRAVLFAYGVGHLVTTTMFLVWPDYFLTGRGDVPPWPLSILQFGVWPPTHVGFMNVLGVYDLAVAVALFIAAWNPLRHTGLLVFFGVLWIGHGAVHGYHVLWGDSPSVYWWTTVELWLGVVLLAVLYPLANTAEPVTREGSGRTNRS